jgi:glycine betaine/proline transport system ATP-binding protein
MISGNGGPVRISCRGVWKIFGTEPKQVLERTDLGMMDKDQVAEATGHVLAVKDVSFDVTEGEVFVVMGLSGSGKSTLIRCLNRLIEPTTGEIEIDGVDISRLSNSELRMLRRHKVCMVFQHFALLPHRTVIDNVAYGLEVQGMSKAKRHEKAAEMIEMVGLKGWEDNYPDELSGGMQQRVGLARSLAIEAEIMLLDEAFSALDPLIRRQMQDEFINLIMSKVKKTIVFITHDLNEALKMGDRIAIMKDGEIVQLGTPEDIVSTPADDYVTEFVRDVPLSKVVRVSSVMRWPEVMLYGWQGPKVALHEMSREDVNHALVVDRAGKFRGSVSLDDVRHAAQTGITRLEQMELDETVRISPDQYLDDAIPLAATSGRSIAVVDDGGSLVGEVPHVALLMGMAGQEENQEDSTPS